MNTSFNAAFKTAKFAGAQKPQAKPAAQKPSGEQKAKVAADQPQANPQGQPYTG